MAETRAKPARLARLPRPRFGWQTVAAAASALVLVGAIVTAYERAGGRDATSPIPPAAAGEPTLQAVLARAALAASSTPVVQGNGPYKYQKFVLASTTGGSTHTVTQEVWLPVEYGTGMSRIVAPNGTPGEEFPVENLPPDDPALEDIWPPLSPAEEAAVPTNAADLLAFVQADHELLVVAESNGVGTEAWPPTSVFNLIGYLLRPSNGLAPDQRAAAFEALGLLPGVTVEANLADAAGREGIGIVYEGPYRRETLFLDPTDYRMLGTKEVVTSTGDMPPDVKEHVQVGDIVEIAYLEVGRVDEIGQLP